MNHIPFASSQEASSAYNLRPRERKRKGPLWEIKTSSSITYIPSEEAKRRHGLKDVVRIELQDLVNEWTKTYVYNSDANKTEQCQQLLNQATSQSLLLLFSERSLSAIYSMFIDQSEDAAFEDTVHPDCLYQAYRFLVKNFNSLRHVASISLGCQSIGLGYSFLQSKFRKNGGLSWGCVYFNHGLVKRDHAPEFQEHRLHFMILLLCDDLIDLIVANTFEKSEDGSRTPDQKKFRVETKHHPEARIEASLAWERHVYGALVFADHQVEYPHQLKKIILDVFEEKNGSINEYFGTPQSAWLNNLLLGCQAKTLVEIDSVLSVQEEEKVVPLFLKVFERDYKYVKIRF